MSKNVGREGNRSGNTGAATRDFYISNAKAAKQAKTPKPQPRSK